MRWHHVLLIIASSLPLFAARESYSQLGFLKAGANGCHSNRKCKSLGDSGLADTPVVREGVWRWATRHTRRTLRHLHAVTYRVSAGDVEKAFDYMLANKKPINVVHRAFVFIFKDGKLYVLAASELDEPEVEQGHLPYWIPSAGKMVLEAARLKPIQDFEGLFIAAGRCHEMSTFKLQVPVFCSCYDSLHQHRVVPFPRSYSIYYHGDTQKVDSHQEILESFKQKIPKAVFRGALSGPARIPLFELGKRDKTGLLDIAMTKIPKGATCKNDTYYNYDWCEGAESPTENPGVWAQQHNLTVGPSLNDTQLSGYRYIIVTDGVGCPDRLSSQRRLLFGGSSLIFWDRSVLEEFWFNDLLPYVHYVPIKPDFSDITQQVEHYNKHPEEAATIIHQAQKYAMNFVNHMSWLAYTNTLLQEYASYMINGTVHVPDYAVQLTID